MQFQIRSRWTGAVKYECELSADVAGKSYGLQLGFAIKKALAEKVDLRGSNLRGSNLSDSDLRGSNLSDSNLSDSDLRGSDLSDSDLRGSNLRGSNLSDSDLRGSNLSDSDLRGSNLRGSDLSDSNLRGSNLRGSNLSDSDLRGSNLRGSDLSDSNLRGSNLRGSDLSGSDLRGSNLRPIRDDIWAILSSAPAEAIALRDSIKNGKIDGSTYSGDCACLVGTLAQARGVSEFNIPGLSPNGSRPAECFFLAIRPGDTPETSQFSALAYTWVDEWIVGMQAAFAAKAAA